MSIGEKSHYTHNGLVRFWSCESQGVYDLKNQDYYQVLPYCIATNGRRGLIIYPRHEGVSEQEFRIRNTEIDVEQCLLDCGLPITDFEAECDRFSEYVLSLATNVTAARPHYSDVLPPG